MVAEHRFAHDGAVLLEPEVGFGGSSSALEPEKPGPGSRCGRSRGPRSSTMAARATGRAVNPRAGHRCFNERVAMNRAPVSLSEPAAVFHVSTLSARLLSIGAGGRRRRSVRASGRGRQHLAVRRVEPARLKVSGASGASKSGPARGPLRRAVEPQLDRERQAGSKPPPPPSRTSAPGICRADGAGGSVLDARGPRRATRRRSGHAPRTRGEPTVPLSVSTIRTMPR